MSFALLNKFSISCRRSAGGASLLEARAWIITSYPGFIFFFCPCTAALRIRFTLLRAVALDNSFLEITKPKRVTFWFARRTEMRRWFP